VFGLDGATLTGFYQAFLLLYPLVVVELFVRGRLQRLSGVEGTHTALEPDSS
jgi:hypothetical protein